MSAADIAAARARLERAREAVREVGVIFGRANTDNNAAALESTNRRHLWAVSDLLLAMTAPEPAPAEPALPAAVVPWVTALREVGAHLRWEGHLINVWKDGGEVPIGWVRPDGAIGALDRGPMTTTPADLVAALCKALGQEGPAKEPEVRTIAEARADVAREVKPERVAVLRHRDHWVIYSDATDSGLGGSDDWTEELGTARLIRGRLYMLNTDGFYEATDGTFTALIDWPPAPTPEPESADDRATRIGRELDPTPVVAALEPAPAGPPSLWEWVRAACVSRLGDMLGKCSVEARDRMVWLGWGRTPAGRPRVTALLRQNEAGAWSGDEVYHVGVGVVDTCTTPAELTAALDALAEEVSRG